MGGTAPASADPTRDVFWSYILTAYTLALVGALVLAVYITWR